MTPCKRTGMRSHARSCARSAWTRISLLALALTAGLAACDDTTPSGPRPEPTPSPARGLGVIEVTITGIGTDATASTALSAPTVEGLQRLRASAAPRPGVGPSLQSLDVPANTDDSGDGTIQLEPVRTGSFTDGERGAGGERFLFATFRVRNAQADGTPYDTERRNLTFLAVDTDSTIGETAVSRLKRFDGSAADEAIAAELTPMGAVVEDEGGNVDSRFPDVLQVLSEAEAADVLALASEDVSDVFPYGFVVRNPGSPTSRTLTASPAANEYDGLVTFAFKLPLQASAADDPFMVSAVFVATDDDEVRITQSFEEQTPAARAAFDARAAEIGATQVTLLPGGTYAGGATRRFACTVRTAGTAAAPVAHLVNAPVFSALSPDPYSGAGSFIADNSSLEATFSRAVSGVGATTFVVNGSQSGRAFLGAPYSGDGTPTITTPGGDFFPGEEVEVTLTHELGSCLPHVVRLRVASGPASGTFGAAVDYGVGNGPASVAAADLNGDGRLDLATANVSSNNVSVLLGVGDGTFGAAVGYGAGDGPLSVAAADLNGDGRLDLAAANQSSTNVSVLLGQPGT